MRNSKFRIGILIIAAVIFSETQVGSQEALKIFPGAKVVWEKQYEVPLDFRVAKRSGNLILKKGSEVLYFDQEGRKVLWRYKLDYPYMGLGDVSDNGQAVCLQRYFEKKDMKEHIILDESGRVLFTMKRKEFVHPSPDGKYFRLTSFEDVYDPLQIYNRQGEPIWEELPPGLKDILGANMKFVGDDKLLVLSLCPKKRKELRLVSLPNGEIIWSYPVAIVGPPEYFTYGVNVSITDNYIAYCGYDLEFQGHLYLFSVSDGFLWEREDISLPVSVTLSDDGKYLFVLDSDQKNMYLIDTATGETLTVYSLGGRLKRPGFSIQGSEKFFLDYHTIVLSGGGIPSKTYILRFSDDWKTVQEFEKDGLIVPVLSKRFMIQLWPAQKGIKKIVY